MLEQEHYLGNCPQGRQLLQVVEYKGHWVALLDWGPACWKLADREAHIGWTHQQRAARLALIVQNWRFLVLGKEPMPNLASRSLGLALKALPEHWQERYGFRPLIAETFTDIEQFEGTGYKATGWQPLGLTKGFQRHRADYFQKHGRPKKLWIKSLNRNSVRILTAMEVPKAYQSALNNESPERDLALKKTQMESLLEHLRKHFKDPRRSNRSYRASSLLVFIAMALFAGRETLTSIQRYGKLLTGQQRLWLGFPLKKGTKNTRRVPSWRALHNFLTQIDPKEFSQCLNTWLGSNLGTLPRALAVDGKWIRDRALSLCLSEHETGAPVAVGFAAEISKTDANKREGEQTVALELYEKTNLEGAIITGAALNNNKAQARAILKAGGDYFLQLKNENRHAYKAAEKLAEQATPFFTHIEEADTTHGRFDQRTRTAYPFEPLEANLPGARSLTVIRRTRTTEPEEVPKVAFYISSITPEESCAARFAQLARGHWGGCEIRNHWVRDHCMREDKTRSKNYNLNCALAGLRVCLITIKSLLYPTQCWPELQERCQRYPELAFLAAAKMRAK